MKTKKNKKVSVITLGCAKNLVDSEYLVTGLKHIGYSMTSKVNDSSIVIINTCGFLDIAREESVEKILEIEEKKQKGLIDKVIVMGCLAERYGDELQKEIPGVDKFFGSEEHEAVIRFISGKDFNLDDLVLDLERVREKTNIQKAHFMGHSLGGMIAPAYAKKFPERVLSVGLLSTVAGRSDEDKQKVWNVISDLKDKGVEKTLKNLTNRWFTDNFIEKNPDLVSRRLKQVIDTDKDVFINVFKIYAETEMISWLKDIKKPCLFMTGENDGGCTPSHNKKMSNEVKDSKLVIIPEVKHSFLIEAPDQIANNLIEFIENI